MDDPLDEQVEHVVNGFRDLTAKQQAEAWMEIEKFWKSLTDEQAADPNDPGEP
jgi:hypothetical protein